MTITPSLEDKIFKTFFKNTPLPALIIDPKSAMIIESNKAANVLYGLNILGKKLTHIDQITKKADRKSTRLNSSHTDISRMPSSA